MRLSQPTVLPLPCLSANNKANIYSKKSKISSLEKAVL
jgi:hypothetical protein